MYLQGTKSACERLLLIACDVLITKKQHLIFKESGAQLNEGGFIELREMYSAQFGAQGSGAEVVPYFLPKEQEAVLAAAEGQDWNFIAVMLGTGIGPGELCAVRPTDVDFKIGRSGRIFVGGTLGRFRECDELVHKTKTEGPTRYVDIHDSVAPVTKALRDQLKVPHTMKPTPILWLVHRPLFANEKGDCLDFPNWRCRNWKRILRAAGVTYRSLYACRHTYAVRMLELGRDIVYVAKQMGHTSTEMIHRHYARWLPDTVQVAEI